MVKYLVMENHDNYSIVMDETGMFHNVKNTGYQIGEIINEPIFIDSPGNTTNFNLKKVLVIVAIFICMILAGLPFINNSQTDVSVYMTINPAIHVDLTEAGRVNAVVADNSDGKDLLTDYTYKGKNVAVILADLIKIAEQKGYLEEGGSVNITVKTNGDNNAESVMSNIVNSLNEIFEEKFAIEIRMNTEKFVALSTLAIDNYETAKNVQDVYQNYLYAANVENVKVNTVTDGSMTVLETYESNDTEAANENITDMEDDSSDPTESITPSDPVEPEDPTEPSDPVEPEDPTEPSDPVEPEDPTEPSDPVEPEDPTEPSDPVEPEDPTEPSDPVEPEDPTEPSDPVEPEDPTEPSDPVEPEDPTEPGDPVEPEDPTEPSDPVEPEYPTEPSDPVEPEDPTEPGDPVEPEDPTEPSYPVEPEDPTEPSDPVEPEDPTEPSDPVEPPEDEERPGWPGWPWWPWDDWFDWLKNII